MYDDVLVRRWRNELGRTMWEFPAIASEDPRFLIIGHGRPASRALAANELGLVQPMLAWAECASYPTEVNPSLSGPSCLVHRGLSSAAHR